MAFFGGSGLERDHFKIHSLEFAIASDLYILLLDWNAILLRFVDGSVQIEQQAFSSHLQNVKVSSAGRELEIKAHLSTGLKDFQVFINHHSHGSVLRQEDAISLFVYLEEAHTALTLPACFLVSRKVSCLEWMLASGEVEVQPGWGRFSAINLVLSIHQLKQIRSRAKDAFRAPQ